MADRASDPGYWDSRAALGELEAVIDPEASTDKNALVHALHVHAIGSVGLNPTDDVLDFGCGSGRLLRELAPIVGRIRGIDISPRMVEVASRYGEASVYDGESIPFPDASFTAVVSVYVIQMYRDRPRTSQYMLAELSRILRLDGRLVLIERVEPDGPLGLEAWLGDLESAGFTVERTRAVRSARSRFDMQLAAAGLARNRAAVRLSAGVHSRRGITAPYTDVLFEATRRSH